MPPQYFTKAILNLKSHGLNFIFLRELNAGSPVGSCLRFKQVFYLLGEKRIPYNWYRSH